MPTPPHEDDISDVEPVNEAAAGRTPDKPPEASDSDDADPGDALESLWHQVARVEAAARAARDSLASLPPLRRSNPEEQRAVERVHALVTLTAEIAEDALTEAEEQLARLAEHTVKRRAGEGR